MAEQTPVHSGDRADSLSIGRGPDMTDASIDFQAKTRKIPPRILCIGMPVRDLTFRVPGLPARGSKEHASHVQEICGGNALNAAIGIARLGGQASIFGPMGDANETSSRYIFEQMAHEGIDTSRVVHMQGLVTPISSIMIDPSGERTIVTFRDPKLWRVKLPASDALLKDCDAILTESRCAAFCTDLCAEAVRRGIPVVVDVDHAMSQREGLLSASTHLVFSNEPLQETAGLSDDGEALKKLAKLTPSFLAATRGPRGTIWLARKLAGDARLCTPHRGYGGRRRRLPWRLRAGDHRGPGAAAGAAICVRCGSSEMHPLRRRLCRPATS